MGTVAHVSTEPAREPGDGSGARPVWVTVLKGCAFLLLPVLAVWYLAGQDVPTVDEVKAFVEGFGAWGPLVFAGLFVVVAATPVPVTIMAVSGGFLGRDALRRIAGGRVEAAEGKLRGKGFLTVLVLRPVLPNWTLSYGAGLVRIPQRDYLGATLLGGMPGQISFAAVGAFTSRPSWPALAVVAASWTLVVVVGVLSWRHVRRTDPGGPAPGSAEATD